MNTIDERLRDAVEIERLESALAEARQQAPHGYTSSLLLSDADGHSVVVTFDSRKAADEFQASLAGERQQAERTCVPIEQLLEEYAGEGCYFTDMESVKRVSQRYVKTMPDSHVRCLLHVLSAAPPPSAASGHSVPMPQSESQAWHEISAMASRGANLDEIQRKLRELGVRKLEVAPPPPAANEAQQPFWQTEDELFAFGAEEQHFLFCDPEGYEQIALEILAKFGKRASQPAPGSAEPRKPDGYAYRYPSPLNDGTVVRFNSGVEVNGSKPIEAVPYWFGAPPADARDALGLIAAERRPTGEDQ